MSQGFIEAKSLGGGFYSRPAGVPVWPASLPQVALREGYKHTPGSNITVFEPDVGMPKTDRRSMSAPSTIELTMLLRKSQLDLVKRFADEYEGVSFILPEPTDEDWDILAKIMPRGNKEAYSAPISRGGGWWLVTLSLLVWPNVKYHKL